MGTPPRPGPPLIRGTARRRSWPWPCRTRLVPADDDAALAPRVVARVEGLPPVAEPDLRPGLEVHWGLIRRDVHVGQVAEDIPGRTVQRPAEEIARWVKSRQASRPAVLTSAVLELPYWKSRWPFTYEQIEWTRRQPGAGRRTGTRPGCRACRAGSTGLAACRSRCHRAEHWLRTRSIAMSGDARGFTWKITGVSISAT